MITDLFAISASYPHALHHPVTVLATERHGRHATYVARIDQVIGVEADRFQALGRAHGARPTSALVPLVVTRRAVFDAIVKATCARPAADSAETVETALVLGQLRELWAMRVAADSPTIGAA
jgi:hypothetical protein